MLTENLTEAERQYYYMEQCRQWVEKQVKELGRPLTASVVTFGCQVNTEHEIRKAA